jgi:hypothetical protein
VTSFGGVDLHGRDLRGIELSIAASEGGPVVTAWRKNSRLGYRLSEVVES